MSNIVFPLLQCQLYYQQIGQTIRRLPSNTNEHIPWRLRARLLRASRQVNYRIADRDELWAQAGEAMWKLILARIAPGKDSDFEIGVRTDLWEAGQFATLLERIEQQRAQRLSAA